MNFRLSGVFSSYRMRFATAIAVLACLAATVAPGVAQQDDTEEAVNREIGRAKIYMEQGDFDTALFFAKRAIEMAPENQDALTIYAEIGSIWQPRYNKVERDKSLAKLKGEKPELVLVGDMLEARQPDKAIETIEKSLSIQANDNRKGLHHWLLARAYGRKGDTRKYLQHLQEAIGWEKGNFLQAKLDLITFYLSQQRLQEAGNMLGMLRSKGQGGPRQSLLQFYFTLMAGDADGVIKYLQAYLANWTRNPNVGKDIVSSGYNLVGQAYYARSNQNTGASAEADMKLALEALENAYEIDPLHTQSLLMLADFSNKEGDFKKALEYCDKVVERDKDDKNVQRVYGTIYMLQSPPDLAKATAAFKTLVDDDGKQTNASLLGQGHAAFLAGDAKAACEKYAAVIKRITDEGEDVPTSLEIYSAYASMASGNKAQAVVHLDNVFDNEENSLYTAEEYIQAMGITAAADYQLFMRATILNQENWLEAAETEWKALLVKYPKCLPAAQSLMRIYMAKKEDLEKAQAIADRIEKEIVPDFSKNIPIGLFTEASMVSAKLKYAEKMTEKRELRDQLINIYTKIKTDFPDRPEAWRALINLYISRGNDDTAKQLCEESLRKFPIDNVIFRYYASVLERLKDNETLNKAYENFIVKTEEDGKSIIGLLYGLARVYNNQGKTDLAVEKLKALREAIRQESKGDAEKLAQLRKTYIDAYSLLRYLAARQSDIELELKVNELMEEIDKDGSGLDYTKGFRAFLLKDLPTAIKHFEAEMLRDRLDTYHLRAIAGKGMAAFQSGDIKTAIAAFDRADEIADCLQEMAQATADNQTYNTAGSLRDWIRFYKTCAHLADGNVNTARSNLLRCRIIFPAKPGEPNSNSAKTRAFDAVDLRKALGGLSGANNDNYYHLAAGMFYAMRGYFPKADSEFDLEIKANPGNFIALYLKGMTLLNMRSEETRTEAIKMFRESLKLEPKFTSAQHQIMVALMQAHQEQKTDESLQAVIDCFGALVNLDKRYNEDLAQFYQDEEDYDKAVKQFVVCANLDSDYIGNNKMNYLNQAAWLAAENLADKAELADAVKNAKEALNLMEARITIAAGGELPMLKSTKGSILDTLARAQYKLATITTGATKAENIKEAKANLNTAIALIEEGANKQSLPAVLSHLGDVLLLEGKKKEALEQYQKADEYTRFADKKHVQKQIEILSKELE